MKTKAKFYPGIALLLFISFNCYAQQDSISEKINHFKISVSYNSQVNYYGRTDSLKSSAVLPAMEAWLNKNLYISATPIFINNNIQKFEYSGTVATAGYQFNHKNKLAGHIYVVKPFYKQSADLVQSALKAQATANITRLTKYLNITGGADIKFSNKQDLGLTVGVDHVRKFRFRRSVLLVDPSLYIFGGTQRFTETYLSKKEGFLLFPGREEIVSKQTAEFSVIAYEFSIPVIFNIRDKIHFLFTPAYVVPKNDPIAKNGIGYVTSGVKLLL